MPQADRLGVPSQSYSLGTPGYWAPVRQQPLGGSLRPEVQTLTLSYTSFDRRDTYPFHLPSKGNCFPFICLYGACLINFPLEDPSKCLDKSAVREIFWKSLLIPKCKFSQPFSILQLMKSFLYTSSLKKVPPFGRSLPIVHYRECNPPPPHPLGSKWHDLLSLFFFLSTTWKRANK